MWNELHCACLPAWLQRRHKHAKTSQLVHVYTHASHAYYMSRLRLTSAHTAQAALPSGLCCATHQAELECCGCEDAGEADSCARCRFLALSWAAKCEELAALEPDNANSAPGLQAQRLYSRFSNHVRAVAPVMLPTALPPPTVGLPATRASASGSSAMGASPVGDAAGMRRRTWWGGRRKPRPPGQAGTFAAAAQPAAGARHKTVHSKSQVVGDFIQGKQWGSQPMKQGLKDGVPTARVKGALSVSKKRSSSAQNLVALAPAVAPVAQVLQPDPAGALRCMRPSLRHSQQHAAPGCRLPVCSSRGSVAALCMHRSAVLLLHDPRSCCLISVQIAGHRRPHPPA